VIRTKGAGDFRRLKAEIEKTFSNARIDKR
jgi:hypothetical protein